VELHFVVGRTSPRGSFRAVESGAVQKATDLQDSWQELDDRRSQHRAINKFFCVQ
jgi:hypothetical protein